MDISVMRKAVAGVYPGIKWQERCRYMPDNQIFAIYKSFEAKGRFNRPNKAQNSPNKAIYEKNADKNSKDIKEAETAYYQYSIFDYI